jgi:hypothetical protein
MQKHLSDLILTGSVDMRMLSSRLASAMASDSASDVVGLSPEDTVSLKRGLANLRSLCEMAKATGGKLRLLVDAGPS